MVLRLFYDGACPLCVAEMGRLRRRDTQGRLAFEDIQQPDFGAHFPHIDPVAARERLHGELADGTLLLGLDATCYAWGLVGHSWLSFLRWPLLRRVADGLYLTVARHRYRLSRWWRGQGGGPPEQGACSCSSKDHEKGVGPPD